MSKISKINISALKGKQCQGVVVSSKPNKTVVVRVDAKVKHPRYGKIITRSNKFHAHDEHNACQEGDRVVIQETRPISKLKTWIVLDIVERVS